MTKKMTKIIETYTEKMNGVLFTYEKGFCTYEAAKKELSEKHTQFDELRRSMFHYDLLSEKDFEETCHVGTEIYFEFYDNLLDMYFMKKREEEKEEEEDQETEETEETEENTLHSILFETVKAEYPELVKHEIVNGETVEYIEVGV